MLEYKFFREGFEEEKIYWNVKKSEGHNLIILNTCLLKIFQQVLDELLRILNTLKYPQQPPRAHEFLQELRDISSMAMEHFEEKIAPSLKTKMPAVTLPYPFSDCSSREQSPGNVIDFILLFFFVRESTFWLYHWLNCMIMMLFGCCVSLI